MEEEEEEEEADVKNSQIDWSCHSHMFLHSQMLLIYGLSEGFHTLSHY